MKAILLVNMGAPDSEKAMKSFLKRMFSDKAIMYAPAIVRFVFSNIISRVRYKSSWKKYESIGGTPLLQSMEAYRVMLQNQLNDNYIVHAAYSYSHPLINDEIIQMYQQGIREFIVISMYPQSGFSTTGSIKTEIYKIQKVCTEAKFNFIENYFDHPAFIQFWVNLIRAKIENVGYNSPFLLFSSHAVPQSFVERGDTYTRQLELSAKLIANQLNLNYDMSYQSKIGPVSWTKPSTYDYLKMLKIRNVNEIVLIPLSFVNENLETKYDLDSDIIPYAKNETGITDICRVQIPTVDENLIKMFVNFIEDANN